MMIGKVHYYIETATLIVKKFYNSSSEQNNIFNIKIILPPQFGLPPRLRRAVGLAAPVPEGSEPVCSCSHTCTLTLPGLKHCFSNQQETPTIVR